MTKQSLNENWSMQIRGQESIYACRVPCSAYDTLIKKGVMGDPFWRDNEDEFLKLCDNDFIFRSSFQAGEEILASTRQILRFEGIDTIADMELNGVALGHTDNMHRSWEFEVGGILKRDNELVVSIASPTKYIREAFEECYVDGCSDAMEGFPHIRKAHCMYGWDWGPRLPDAGIWRDVTLLGTSHALLDSVLVRQDHRNGAVALTMEPALKYADPDAHYTYQVTVLDPDGAEAAKGGLTLDIADPRLWWPNGYGKQELYTVSVSVMEGEKVLDTWSRKIGLRTLVYDTSPDQWGSRFQVEVNGTPIFSMGADYIPEDNIFPRINMERTRRLLLDCVKANFNTVRVWGGGYYPDDYFFDICDELGLLVWQDFMMACAVIELTEHMEENLAAELTENIKRLRHHASLGLWCGNNEMEWEIGDNQWNSSRKQVSDYVKMYQYIFPKLVKTYDPQRFYWPSSPSSGGDFDHANDFNRGDVHYWEVWHGNKPFSDYRNYYFRYCSEFGFQSFPCLKTVRAFTEPEDRNVFSYIMEKHQRNKTANGKILTYLSDIYLYPARFDDLLYTSQLLQAEAIKYGVEHWRRNRGRCMGAIYWQLNDCWPVTSWSSIDYFGRWKALHYYAKRFFAPVMLSCQEEGTMTQGINVNAEHPGCEQSAILAVANESMEDFSGTVCWAIRDTSGKAMRTGEQKITVAALSTFFMEKMYFDDVNARHEYLSYELLDEAGNEVSGSTVLFCQPKHFNYRDPHLTCTVEGDYITVYADAYAKSVEIDCEDTDMVLSDNYFDMNAGTRTVRLESGKIGRITLRSVYNIR